VTRELARILRPVPSLSGAISCPECLRRKRSPAFLITIPGVCATCLRDDRTEEATRKLGAAVESIHERRRWARSLDMPLLAERCQVTWKVWDDGNEEAKASGDGIASLYDAHALLCGPRLVITGPQTGAGKTSIAVALFRMFLDAAHTAWVGGQEARMGVASAARFFAAIDLVDPEIMARATATPFLVLDDAGRECERGGYDGDRRRADVADLLDRRERTKGKRTIVTTYGTQQQWASWYGGRIERLWWVMPGAIVLEVKKS
jgi:hypothetical protein